MDNQRLIHDCAWATARHIIELFGPGLGEEERREAFVEVNVRVQAGLECFQTQADRAVRRLKPGRN